MRCFNRAEGLCIDPDEADRKSSFVAPQRFRVRQKTNCPLSHRERAGVGDTHIRRLDFGPLILTFSRTEKEPRCDARPKETGLQPPHLGL